MIIGWPFRGGRVRAALPCPRREDRRLAPPAGRYVSARAAANAPPRSGPSSIAGRRSPAGSGHIGGGPAAR